MALNKKRAENKTGKQHSIVKTTSLSDAAPLSDFLISRQLLRLYCMQWVSVLLTIEGNHAGNMTPTVVSLASQSELVVGSLGYGNSFLYFIFLSLFLFSFLYSYSFYLTSEIIVTSGVIFDLTLPSSQNV